MNKYVGSRYVPIYIGVHDDSIEYEPLSIVSNEEKTETFTSKQHVPTGIALSNETYWVQSGFSNADLTIEVDNAPVVSTDDSELLVEKTTSGYLLTLSDSNSFDCGGEYGTPYTLNTMYDVGRYMIKPSICTGVPTHIKDINTPAELVITDYDEIGAQFMRQCQKITAYDDDNAASFIRTHDGEKWSEWKMIGGNGGGSYTLPIATDTVLGGVKIGNGINITDDGKISVIGGTATAGWTKLDSTTFAKSFKTSAFNNYTVSVKDVYANENSNLAFVTVEFESPSEIDPQNDAQNKNIGWLLVNSKNINICAPESGSRGINAFGAYATAGSVVILYPNQFNNSGISFNYAYIEKGTSSFKHYLSTSILLPMNLIKPINEWEDFS